MAIISKNKFLINHSGVLFIFQCRAVVNKAALNEAVLKLIYFDRNLSLLDDKIFTSLTETDFL